MSLGRKYNKKIPNASEIVPDHLSVNNEDYISFLNGYTSFLESHSKLVEYLHIIDNKDIDISGIHDHLKTNVGLSIPDTYTASKEQLYKELNELYRTSGTTESLKLFFKIFYESPNIEVHYPGQSCLTASPDISVQGHLNNSNIRIQDSFFYQIYSYMILNVNVNRREWNKMFQKSQHPAGYIMFSEIVYSTIVDHPVFSDITANNTCIERTNSQICSMIIRELITFDISSITAHAKDSLMERILLFFSKLDRPFGMNAWFDQYKFILISSSGAWNQYTINDVGTFSIPGNIEASLNNLGII
jgi:hypothetical protein